MILQGIDLPPRTLVRLSPLWIMIFSERSQRLERIVLWLWGTFAQKGAPSLAIRTYFCGLTGVVFKVEVREKRSALSVGEAGQRCGVEAC
jgi:hypothetical protein